MNIAKKPDELCPVCNQDNIDWDCPECFGAGEIQTGLFVTYEEWEVDRPDEDPREWALLGGGISRFDAGCQFVPCGVNPSKFIVTGLYDSYRAARDAFDEKPPGWNGVYVLKCE
jgi:hypothetical protein